MRLFLSSSRNLAVTMSVICLVLCLALSGAGEPARALAAGNVAFGAADTGWQRVALPGMRVRWLAAAPANPALIYAGVDGAGAYVSNDGGETWSMLPASGLTNLAVQTITVCPSGTPYVGTWGSGVFRFSSGSWQRASDGLRNDYIAAMSCDDQGVLLAGTYSDGVFRSTDGGRLLDIQQYRAGKYASDGHPGERQTGLCGHTGRRISVRLTPDRSGAPPV